jgi:hypothetical protein
MLCRVSRLAGQRFPGGVLEQDKHYAALDGLRGFAAVSVVIFHIGHWLDMPSLAANAGLAVDVFLLPQRLCPVARLWQVAGEDPF